VKEIKIILFVVVIVGCFYSCENEKKTSSSVLADTKDSVDEVKSTMKFDSSFDKTVNVFSGIKQSSENEFSYIDTTAGWRNFASGFDSSWALIDEKRFSKMKVWRDAELTDLNAMSTNLFYPFSGPDILNAFILFPNAKAYTLLALEPIGDLPDFKKMTERQRQEYYLSVELSLNDLMNKSYFITRNMLKDLQKHKVNGTLPLICLFLKRTGNTIVDIKKIGIDSSGSIVQRNDTNKFKGTYGVKVDFITKESDDVRSVYYFKCDLADTGIKYNKGLSRYLQNLGEVNTYLKSASYLLHYKEFSVVRNTVFEKSKGIVQDDSGIAYHYFDKDKWNIELYGKYVKPVADFPHIKEPDLKAAYENDSTIQLLPFELGYHWGTRANNMLKATKKI